MYHNDLKSVIKHLQNKNYVIDCVYDIGANKGNWTNEYSKLLPNATFVCFEANPNHTKPKSYKKHYWFNEVLSDSDDRVVDFFIKDDSLGTGNSYYKEQTTAYSECNPMQLKTKTLNTLVKEHSLPKPKIIKLDTQGSELDILKGASNIIKNADIIISEISILSYNKGAPVFSDYISFMDKLDFLPIGIDEIHFIDNMLIQMDIVFMRTSMKNKYYSTNNFLNMVNT